MPAASPGRSTPVGRPKPSRAAQSTSGSRPHLPGMVEEIDVATLGQGVGQRHVAVADAVADIDLRTAAGRARAGIPGSERLLRIEPGRFQQGHGGERFEHRAGRQGHLHDAIEQGMGRRGKQGRAARRVSGRRTGSGRIAGRRRPPASRRSARSITAMAPPAGSLVAASGSPAAPRRRRAVPRPSVATWRPSVSTKSRPAAGSCS